MIAVTTQRDDHRPPAVNGRWTESKRDGWTYERADEWPERPQSWCDAPAFNVVMARLTEERGYLNLSQAHALAARDCPRGCPCQGCEATRAEAEVSRAMRQKRMGRTRRVEA